MIFRFKINHWNKTSYFCNHSYFVSPSPKMMLEIKKSFCLREIRKITSFSSSGIILEKTLSKYKKFLTLQISWVLNFPSDLCPFSQLLNKSWCKKFRIVEKYFSAMCLTKFYHFWHPTDNCTWKIQISR